MHSTPFRVFRFIALLVAALLGGAVAYLRFALPDVGPAPTLKVEPTPTRIARGAYLAHHVTACMDCHSVRDWTRFSGPLVPGTLGKGGEAFDRRFGFPGSFPAPNLTPAGIGTWTDGELYRAITTGVSRDGHALFPVMPYIAYGQLDPEDVKSIIAYLRTLAPIANAVPKSKPDFPVNVLINTMPKKAAPRSAPRETDTVAYGAYLANAAGCAECHTRQERGKKVGAPFAGGFEFNLGGGNIARSANITPHQSGIKSWTREQFILRFKAYAHPSATPKVDPAKGEPQTVMPWTMFAGMAEQDLGAIYDFLRTVTPVESHIERWTSPTPSAGTAGD